MKIIIIGGVAAGAKVAAKSKRLLPDADIHIYTQDTHVSYSACGLPYYIEGNFATFKEQESKLLMLSDDLEDDKEEKKVETKVVTNKKRSPLKLEEMISKLEKEIEKIKQEQFLEENYMDYKKMSELDSKLKKLEEELSSLEEEYLSL